VQRNHCVFRWLSSLVLTNKEASNTHPHPTTFFSALGPGAAYSDLGSWLFPEFALENAMISP
jgi:hypothetical protein